MGLGGIMRAVLHGVACLECNQVHSKELNKSTALDMQPLNFNALASAIYCLSIVFRR